MNNPFEAEQIETRKNLEVYLSKHKSATPQERAQAMADLDKTCQNCPYVCKKGWRTVGSGTVLGPHCSVLWPYSPDNPRYKVA